MSHGHSIRCHSPFKHYTMFHSSSSLGNFNNSIFGGFRCSTTYNINVNDGGFWGGFRNGLGMGFGNFLGGLFGGFMGGGLFGGMFGGFGNMFGGMFGGGMGFGFPWGGGFGGGYGNYGGGYGDYGDGAGAGRRRTRTNSDRSTNSTDGTNGTNGSNASGKCEDKDQAEINALDKRLNALDSTKNPEEALALYNEISKLIQNPKDADHADENKENYELKLARLIKNWDFKKDSEGKLTATPKNPAGTGTGSGTSTASNLNQGDGAQDGKVNGAPQNQEGTNPYADQWLREASGYKYDSLKVPNSVTFSDTDTWMAATADNINEVQQVKEANDLGYPEPVTASGFAISSTKVDGFPEYIVISDTQGKYNYKYLGKVDGKAIYGTPDSDDNNNRYLLTIKKNFRTSQFEFVLYQDRNFENLGYNKPDNQIKNKNAG